jgi:TonB family protein
MMKSILALIILSLATLNVSAAQGAGKGEAAEADRLNAEVLKLYREAKYDEALPIAKRVLELREKALGGEDLKVAYALANLANIYTRKDNKKESEPLYTRALAVLEKHGAAETDFAADMNTQLGLIRVDAGKYKEGEPYLQRTLELREKLHGAESARIVPALLNLVDVNFLRKQPDEAQVLLGRALSILERPPYVKDLATAQRLKNYLCLLMGLSTFGDKELGKQVNKAIWKLEQPERAAEYDKEQKEQEAREARGEVTKKAEGGKQLVAGGVLNGHAVSKPPPDYPSGAKQEGVGGTVIVQILVDESGRVIEAEPVCGHPLLAKAAVEAARKARFSPTTLSGMPVKVSGVITYNFVLQ